MPTGFRHCTSSISALLLQLCSSQKQLSAGAAARAAAWQPSFSRATLSSFLPFVGHKSCAALPHSHRVLITPLEACPLCCRLLSKKERPALAKRAATLSFHNAIAISFALLSMFINDDTIFNKHMPTLWSLGRFGVGC